MKATEIKAYCPTCHNMYKIYLKKCMLCGAVTKPVSETETKYHENELTIKLHATQ